jgi:hypothetical protein
MMDLRKYVFHVIVDTTMKNYSFRQKKKNLNVLCNNNNNKKKKEKKEKKEKEN